MLSLIRQRINHSRDQEIAIAAGEQLKILIIRIEKLIEDE